MKLLSFPLLLAGAVLLSVTGCQTTPTPAIPDDGRVTVNFKDPEKFTDFKDSFTGTDKGREDYMKILRDFLNREARRHLTEGQKLTVTFLDIDMAGDFLPMVSRGNGDIRVVKEIYQPRLKLHFELTGADGTVLKQGDRNLDDPSFMMRTTIGRRDDLYYETQILREWLQQELK